MKKLDINDYALIASGVCVCCSKKDAEATFKKNGMAGDIYLCRVEDSKSDAHLFWVSVGQKFGFLPVFKEDTELKAPKKVTPITKTTMIYHLITSKLGVCYLFSKEAELIYRVLLLPDENMVSNFCAIQGLSPISISIVNIMKIQGNDYVTTCWAVDYENPNEVDEYGEPQGYTLYIPINFLDYAKMADLGLAECYYDPVKENDAFMVQGIVYRACKDESGWYLSKDLFANNKTAKKSKEKCKIIPLKRN